MYIQNDSKLWNQLSNDWWQKVVTTKNGNLVYEYHYQKKSSRRAIVIEIDTKISRQYAGYRLIEKDLRDIILMIDEYKKINSDEKFNSNGILQKALIKAIVITYGKCFAETNGRIKLEKRKVFTIEKDAKEHDKIMRIRHEYIAHAGNAGFEHCKCVLLFPPEKKYTQGRNFEVTMATELIQVVTNQNINEKINSLVDKVHKWVSDKIKCIQELVNNEFNDIRIEEIYMGFKKNRTRIVLNEQKLEKMGNKLSR